jgi:hypothetical protein
MQADLILVVYAYQKIQIELCTIALNQAIIQDPSNPMTIQTAPVLMDAELDKPKTNSSPTNPCPNSTLSHPKSQSNSIITHSNHRTCSFQQAGGHDVLTQLL